MMNPNAYHGRSKRPPFFEGWYFKMVHPQTGNTYCFIPGVLHSSEKGHSHSFIQVFMSENNHFNYIRYRKDGFKAHSKKFLLKVGASSFSLERIHVDICQEDIKISGNLSFEKVTEWPDTIINPGSMGFYNYMGFMECYSQVCAMDGKIKGYLLINGEKVDLTGGKLYIEKNWGRSFPYSYIWVQGNAFDKGDGALTCSIGRIPMPAPLKCFTGFLIGFCEKGRFHKFTTIQRNTLSGTAKEGELFLETTNNEYVLSIQATYHPDQFMDLYAPYDDEMMPKAHETLSGEIKVTLYDRKKKRLVFKDRSTAAGIEFTENYRQLLDTFKGKQ